MFFNIGPMELLVLALVGIVVIGPEKLPGFAKEAANMIRTLRELASGAREQLRDELGPEFADIDLRNLNPRTAVQRAVFGDDVDFGRLNPRNALRDAIFGDEDVRAADPRRVIRETRFDDAGDRHDEVILTEPSRPIRMSKSVEPDVDSGAGGAGGAVKAPSRPTASTGRPRPRPRPSIPYDDDAT